MIKSNMKKNLLLVMGAALMLTIGLGSCDNEDNESAKAGVQVKNFANSGCKNAGTARTRGGLFPGRPEYIEYKAINDGYLSVNHVNTAFNCEPGELKIQATLEGHNIKILETEEQSFANCICPYDLYCEVGPLSDGDYTVIICKGSYEYEYAHFNISYKKGLSGKFEQE
jgi:hypothetical protein